MKTSIKEKIQEILRLYKTIILFEENDCHFGSVFHAMLKNSNCRIITLNDTGGGMTSWSSIQ